MTDIPPTAIPWHIESQYRIGGEVVFHCERYTGRHWHFTSVRVDAIWWASQGSVADILRKAQTQWEAGQKP